jgi:hypothetical protein
LYYIVSIHEDSCTSGQDFNGLKLIQAKPPKRKKFVTDGSSGPEFASSMFLQCMQHISDILNPKQIVYSTLNRGSGDTVYLSLFLSLLPYITSRRTEISSVLSESYAALTAKEEAPVSSSIDSDSNIDNDDINNVDSNINNSSIARNGTSSNGSSNNGSNSGSGGAGYTPITVTAHIPTTPITAALSPVSTPSALSRVIAAIYRMQNHSQPGSGSVPQGFAGWLEALHLFFFLRTGR